MLILDGGTGRQLQRIGAPFGQPEWSALALIKQPDLVLRVHMDFIHAGADIITTNTYSIIPYHIGDQRFKDEAPQLLDRAVKLCLRAKMLSNKNIKIAGAVPPMFGSYAPENFDPLNAPKMLRLFKEKLIPHCDIILAETLSSTAEIQLFQKIFKNCNKPLWVSVTLDDTNPAGNPKLRSGESLSTVIKNIKKTPFDAILFNCSQPEVMADAITIAFRMLNKKVPIGVYANAFPPRAQDSAPSNSDLTKIRSDLTPEKYKAFGREWLELGATIIGGCCGVGPEHIKALKDLASSSD